MMRLIFVGDICSTHQASEGHDLPFLRGDCFVVGNLEGPIAPNGQPIRGTVRAPLFSSEEVLGVLKEFKVRTVSLANNHITDLRDGIEDTVRALDRVGISTFGAGTIHAASRACVIEADGIRVRLYGFSWPVIGGRPASNRALGYAALAAEDVRRVIRRGREDDPNAVIVAVMHWNYELEQYPQPAHRKLAFELLNDSADVVVGHHPHLCGGAELVQGKPVAYSLGNWYFTRTDVGGMPLVFPQQSDLQLALELRISEQGRIEPLFHWCRYDPQRRHIRHETTEDWSGSTLKRLTPFVDLSGDAYESWFRRNRHRRRALPIYKNVESTIGNRARDLYLRCRSFGIQALVRAGVKHGPTFSQ